MNTAVRPYYETTILSNRYPLLRSKSVVRPYYETTILSNWAWGDGEKWVS